MKSEVLIAIDIILQSSEMRLRIVWQISTRFSEECAASILRIEEYNEISGYQGSEY
jgi:hypothetical protein